MASKRTRVGTCETMCPQSEILQRTKAGTLHLFEINEATKRDKFPMPVVGKVVKQFARSSAGEVLNKTELLRPANVLIKTTAYIVEEILPRTDFPWNMVYDFAFDRFRAIRQDLVIQEIHGGSKILILEQMVVFHLYASYALCEMPSRLYDSHINETHIRECLQILLVHYDTQPAAVSRRSCFESIYFLYNLGSIEALKRYRDLPKSLKNHPRVKSAYKASVDFGAHSNCYKVLLKVKSMDAYGLLAIHCNIKTVQKKLLQQLVHGFSSQQCKFPLKMFQSLMCPFETMDEDTTLWAFDVVSASNQSYQDRCIKFNKATFSGDVKISDRKWNKLDECLDNGSLVGLVTGKHIRS